MKSLLTLFLISLLSTNVACANEHDKTPAKTEASKEASKEKDALKAEVKEGEVKQVCVKINGKEKCKKMKMHKKFEGTKIPTKK